MINAEYMSQYSERPKVGREELAKALKERLHEFADGDFYLELADSYLNSGTAGSIQRLFITLWEEQVKNWVEKEGIKPPFGLGEKIIFSHGGKTLIGTVSEINTERAAMVVSIKDEEWMPVIYYEDILGAYQE